MRREELASLRANGAFSGSRDDVRDGFIHLSTPAQTSGTLERHFSDAQGRGESGLALLLLDPDVLGAALVWEKSRGDELFPHYYAELKLEMVTHVIALELDSNHRHVLPENFT